MNASGLFVRILFPRTGFAAFVHGKRQSGLKALANSVILMA
ncbi:MAG TPA: hypothetical protein PK997_03200 [Candidatus Omnitrophota bacterium]|jgi:hypothetical protein|nr:hypothetical protein [Candidatus Omnitrophota bacterium]HQB94197.1 hypothetical protein [Candidatus Omnitrophota bacterium]